MRSRRALAQLLMIVSLTLLQCLQPLLHAHPRQSGAGPAPSLSRIHLPDSLAFNASGSCEGSVPATITAQDESRRVAVDLHAHPAPVPERRLPGTGDSHDPPPASQSRVEPDDPFQIVKPPRGPPPRS
ncbi:MAG: hypothetical protein KAY46_15375 [Burkholderiaceae bacterium]|jgi:hypothetical protein|nr:hypothetical protein [Burkholderiaceae bacterium]